MITTLPDPVMRAIRTFLQSFLGIFLALSMTSGIDQVPDVDALKRAGLAALWGGFVALITFIQNAIEDRSGYSIGAK